MEGCNCFKHLFSITYSGIVINVISCHFTTAYCLDLAEASLGLVKAFKGPALASQGLDWVPQGLAGAFLGLARASLGLAWASLVNRP